MSSETYKKINKRDLKSMIGASFYFIYNLLPVLMIWIYYKAITGNLICIALSVV